MTTPRSSSRPPSSSVIHGSPIGLDGPRVPLHGAEFAADPHRVYREMRRQYGDLVPVELAPGVPATLVIGYHTAVRILHDADHFPADPRIWQQDIPTDCPVLPIMQSRPLSSRSAGREFERYRSAVTASIDEVDLYDLHATVERIAGPLINSFAQVGTADLISQYVAPLAFQVAGTLLGMPPEMGRRAAAALAAMFDGDGAAEGNRALTEVMLELVRLKRAEPGNDFISRLLRHPARLDEVELLNHAMSFHATVSEFEQNLIANTVLLILTNDGFGGDVLGGGVSTRDALDEVLFNDPPVANMCITYPRLPTLIGEVWLPAHQPVVVSMAACNNDPAVHAEDLVGNRSHLAWGAGPHCCPARSMAYLIAKDAIDQLFDVLPELQLAPPSDELVWRPGPFHHALAALPVEFPPSWPLTLNDLTMR